MKPFKKNSTTMDKNHYQGFTLPEMMITVMIFSFVVLAVLGLQIFSMRVYTLGATMVSATTSGRQTMNYIRDQIRAAKNVYVGTINTTNGSTFAQVPNGSPQQGNALEITLTNSAGTNFIVYFQDPASTNICTYSNSVATGLNNSALTILAKNVTNYYCFLAEDYSGNTLTNYVNTPVIHVTMQFCQWEYPIGVIGGNANNSYDFYSLNARVSRRARQ
jgi:prepilin-type N-terminal cleavage/methylation domain-containing protein